MEELFCIGCGAQIQTEDKEKALKQLREMRHAAQRSMFNV